MPIIYSYSLLSCYDVCPRQAYEKYIVKSVKSTYTKETVAGVDLHKHLENRLRKGAPLPTELKTVEPVCASIKGSGLKIGVEVKMGATGDWQPADFFEPRDGRGAMPWLRGVPDVNAYGRGAALLVDWKTGKPRNNTLQHMINAALVFTHYPHTVADITAVNVYTRTGEVSAPSKFTRDELPGLRNAIQALTAEVDAAEEFNHWPEKRGPLCGWCPVTDCRHNPECRPW